MKRSYDHLAATTFLLFGALLANACGASPPDTGPSGAQSSDVYTIGLTAASPGALPKCSSALAGTTAYVQSPTGLWSCINNTWIPLPCATVVAGAVAYSSATQTLLACVQGQWTVISVPSGATGPQGPQGEMGAKGETGAQGAQGDAGAPGSLLKLSDAGSNCATGGQRIDVGVDTNGNGTLDDGEIQQTAYICNGRDGIDGTSARCGDGVVQAGEECDPGVNVENSETCTALCKFSVVARCVLPDVCTEHHNPSDSTLAAGQLACEISDGSWEEGRLCEDTGKVGGCRRNGGTVINWYYSPTRAANGMSICNGEWINP